MPAPEIKVLTIEDFKAGIFSDYHAGTATNGTFDPKINGAAVLEDTWGCTADRSGALVPLPRMDTGQTSALIPPTAGSHGSSLADTYLLDAIVMDGVQTEGSSQPAVPEVVTMHTFIYNTTGSTWSSYILVRRWEPDGSTTADVCFTRNTVTQSHAELASGNLLTTRGSENAASALTPYLLKGFAWVAHPARTTAIASPANFITGAITAEDQALSNYDTLYATAWSNEYPYRMKESLFGYFPNFGTPTYIHPAGPAHLDASATDDHWGAYYAVSHQGRVVFAQMIPSKYVQGTGNRFVWKDRVSSTGPLVMTEVGGSGEFVEENTSGIGVMASLGADELLVVKHKEGGYLLRGSVASPSVVKLPFIESTYGVVSTPVATPMGLVYGSRNGVFVWDGGEASKHISPQLDGFFWNHAGTTDYLGHRARFGWWHPWVMVPNGFMYDTRHQSWWRIDDSTAHQPYSAYAVSDDNVLYAFPWKIGTAAPNNVAWKKGTWSQLTDTWSWKSQPLVETRDMLYKLRNVSIMATATDTSSTLVVTVTGYNEAGAAVTIAPQTFTLAANTDKPQMQTLDWPTSTEALCYIQVKIVAATTYGQVAPKLHRISFGTVDTNPLAVG